MTIRFGIIGCGMIANFHARAIADVADATLAGCFSRSVESANRFADEHGCRVFESLDQMVTSNEIDAVSICTPSGAHLDPAIAAAKNGKHVIIEKPLEVTLEKCDEIIAVCRENQVKLTTVFQSRFHESSRCLKSAVESGRFGKLALANAYVKWHRSQEYYDSGAWRGTWELDGGGALMNQAIHNVDLLQWIMGPVNQLSAFVATLSHERIEVEDTATACLRFENGALGTIEATTSAFPGSLKRLEIYGSQGSAILEDENIVKWEFHEPVDGDEELLERLGDKNETTGGAGDPSAIDYSGHRAQFEDFTDAIRNDRSPLITGEDARRSVEIIRAIYRSAAEENRVKIAP